MPLVHVLAETSVLATMDPRGEGGVLHSSAAMHQPLLLVASTMFAAVLLLPAGVAVEVPADLPPKPIMQRWFAQPLKALLLPTSKPPPSSCTSKLLPASQRHAAGRTLHHKPSRRACQHNASGNAADAQQYLYDVSGCQHLLHIPPPPAYQHDASLVVCCVV